MKIKYDEKLMQIMKLFSYVTKADMKDCIESGPFLVFVVLPGQAGKAIGKNAVNVKTLEKKLRKKVKIVEFNADVLQFIKNYVAPLKLKDIKQEEFGIISMTAADSQTRGLLIGRNAVNLRALEDVVKRYFSVKEIKVN